MLTNWEYIGDVNLEYGGCFVRHDLNENGFPYYSEVIEIIDLDSATGANGLTAINFMTTFGYEDKKKVDNVMSYCGIDNYRKMGKMNILNMMAVDFCSYGYSDPWDDYFRRPSYLVLVNKEFNRFSSKSKWDGWKPNKDETVKLHHEYGGDLEAYLKGEWLE